MPGKIFNGGAQFKKVFSGGTQYKKVFSGGMQYGLETPAIRFWNWNKTVLLKEFEIVGSSGNKSVTGVPTINAFSGTPGANISNIAFYGWAKTEYASSRLYSNSSTISVSVSTTDIANGGIDLYPVYTFTAAVKYSGTVPIVNSNTFSNVQPRGVFGVRGWRGSGSGISIIPPNIHVNSVSSSPVFSQNGAQYTGTIYYKAIGRYAARNNANGSTTSGTMNFGTGVMNSPGAVADRVTSYFGMFAPTNNSWDTIINLAMFYCDASGNILTVYDIGGGITNNDYVTRYSSNGGIEGLGIQYMTGGSSLSPAPQGQIAWKPNYTNRSVTATVNITRTGNPSLAAADVAMLSGLTQAGYEFTELYARDPDLYVLGNGTNIPIGYNIGGSYMCVGERL